MKSEEFATARLAFPSTLPEIFSDIAKVRHLVRWLAGYGGLTGKKLEIMRNIRHFRPFPVKESLQLEFPNHLLVERRTVDDLLILQVAGQVNAVVFADIHHRLRWQQSGMRAYPHLFKNTPSSRQIAWERPFRHPRQLRQPLLAYKLMLIVLVDRKYLLFWYSVYNMFFCSFYLKIVILLLCL